MLLRMETNTFETRVTRIVAVSLPADVLSEAVEGGLLTTRALSSMVERELAFRRFERIRAAFDGLGPDVNPVLALEEVQTIVDRVRKPADGELSRPR